MSRAKRCRGFVAAACVVALGLPASAGAITHASVSIRISADHSKAKGRISSSPACEGGRNVKLYYAFSTGTTFTKVASDTSSPTGKWSIPGPDGTDILSGQLYAKVPRNGKCAKAQSKTIKSEGDDPTGPVVHW